MSYKSVTMLAALALLMLAAAHAQTGQQGQKDEQKDEDIIDGFVTSRGFGIKDVSKPAAKPKPTPRTRRKPSSGGVVKNKPTTTPNGVKPGGGSTPDSTEAAQQDGGDGGTDGGTTPDGGKIVNASDTLLQVGYTLYMKERTGMLLPIPTSKVFRAGDNIMMTLETNADGYLYIFDALNGKDPILIYPDADFNGASNELRAHVSETLPADPRGAFKFDETSGVEHVYIIVSRKPLAGVPTGAALRKFCAPVPKGVDCEWRPTAAQWAPIAASALDSNIREVKSGLLAREKVEPVMSDTISRGIRLKKESPPPAIVRVADTPGATMLVTKIELLHQ